MSRDAAAAVLVERDAAVAASLREVAAALDGDAIRVEQAEALRFLEDARRVFGIVFLDPPFGRGLIERSLARLLRYGGITANSLIYVESEQSWRAPGNMTVLKRACAGNVQYMLVKLKN